MLRFPTCFPSFRVVGEKQLPQEIVFLVWSPKRDLIALANTTGEVSELSRSPSRLQPQFPLLQTWRISFLPCPYISSWRLTSRKSVKGSPLPNVVYSPVWLEEQMPTKLCTPRSPWIDLARDAPSEQTPQTPPRVGFQIGRRMRMNCCHVYLEYMCEVAREDASEFLHLGDI